MFKSTADRFFEQSKEKIQAGWDEIGKMLEDDIKAATPVRTGHLRDSNDYQVVDESLVLYNTADYATFVELGTIFQVAQPFIRETINKDISKITEIMKRNLSS